MSKVNVYANEVDRLYPGTIIARVEYNNKLDYWDGHNWTNGGVGRHLGITRLRDGQYVLIYGTQHQGEQCYGLTVTDREALNEILRSGNEELLEKKKFEPLKKLMKEALIPEMAL